MKAIPIKSDSGQVIYMEVDEDVEIINKNLAGGEIASGADSIKETVGKLKDVGLIITDVCQTIQQQVFTTLAEAKP